MRIQAAFLSVATLLVLAPVAAVGQMPITPKSEAAAGSMATPAAAYDAQISIIESEMMSAVKAMPADKFSFAPSASIYAASREIRFDGVRTFAQQAAHVAQANYYFYSMIGGTKPDVDMGAVGKLTTKDEVVKALGDSFAFAHRAVATITPANAFEVLKTPEPGLQTRATFAGFGVAHAFDHYGQMVEYLRMNGIVPPASAQ